MGEELVQRTALSKSSQISAAETTNFKNGSLTLIPQLPMMKMA